MKLEISHPEGTPHEVELPGKTAVIGRDPGCDIVLSDNRCSRRHAIIEETFEGLVVQDAGSANGIYVNGRKLERARLHPGDTLRIGDTVIQVLPEFDQTLIDRPGEASVTREPERTRGPRPQERSGSVSPVVPPGRAPSPDPTATGLPLTVTVLALLWALLAPVSVAGGIALAFGSGGPAPGGVLWAGAGLILGAVAGLMAVGLWSLAGWSRQLQIAVAGLGLLVCPFTFASGTVLIYMLRPDVRASFEGASGRAGAGDAELTFALSLLGMLVLGGLLTGGAALLV